MKEVWRLTWGLEVFREPEEGMPIFDSPDVNIFRIKFATQDEAYQCKAEIQRYLGDVLLRLGENLTVRIKGFPL